MTEIKPRPADCARDHPISARPQSIAVIEHNLDVIRELCDVAIFLDEGRKLAEDTPERLMQDPVLAERYFK